MTFTVTPGRRVMHMDKATGLWVVTHEQDGAYTLTLAPGDGELVRID